MIICPKISVLLPVYNAELYVEETIKSVLSQTFSDFEIIAVDDGSKDRSLQILKQYKDSRLKVISQENCGLTSTLNTAALSASGKYLARIDADDMCLPERFAKQYEFMERNPQVSVLGTAVEYIDSQGGYIARSFPPLSHRVIAKRIMSGACCIAHPSVMMRADVFRQVGGYDKKIPCSIEDLVLWAKVVASGHHLRNLPVPLIKYRLGANAISNICVDTEYIYLMQAICRRPFDIADEQAERFRLKYLALKEESKKTYVERIRDVVDSKPFFIYRKLLQLGFSQSAAENLIYLIRAIC